MAWAATLQQRSLTFYWNSVPIRKHILTDKMKSLAAAALAQKIGYLRIDDFPCSTFLNNLSTRSFNANRIIRCKDEVLLIKHGLVEIWHTRYDKLVKELGEGALFGETPLLGQTMLGTKAISGTPGATVAVMDTDAVKRWIEENPVLICAELGNRLSEIEAEHYRSKFQLADSRIAGVLLVLAGDGPTIEGVSHQQIGEKIGAYRETVTKILDSMKLDGSIELGRTRITIRDRRALLEMSEL